jgi:spore maturation protein CgeB
LRELSRRGHRVQFLERDLPFYADNRDLPSSPYWRTDLYRSLDELRDRFTGTIRDADVVVVGSYVPEGIAVGNFALQTASGIRAFYDIDTPVTLRLLTSQGSHYLASAQIAEYDLYLSFAGGPILGRLQSEFGSRCARPLYCSADPELYYPHALKREWDLGYLGTYSPDRQGPLTRLLLEVAVRLTGRRFVVAGPEYPEDVRWPANVERVTHLPPDLHRAFYNQQRYTLNVTRRDMVDAGYSPSVRLFEAAAAGTPIISDVWSGLSQFFEPGREILLAREASDVLQHLQIDEKKRRAIAARARLRVLSEHTAAHRAEALERYVTRDAVRARKWSGTMERTESSLLVSGGGQT